jgi:hypothetical protein
VIILCHSGQGQREPKFRSAVDRYDSLDFRPGS